MYLQLFNLHSLYWYFNIIHRFYFASANPTASRPKSYTVKYLLKNTSPMIQIGPNGSGISKPVNADTHVPCKFKT